MYYVCPSPSPATVVLNASQLSPEERLTLAKRVVDKAAGRVSIVASGWITHLSSCHIKSSTGTFGGPVEEQAAFVRQMGAIVSGVVVLTNQFAAQDEPDSLWQERVKQLLDLTPGYVSSRLLNAFVLMWCALPSYRAHKATSNATSQSSTMR